MFRSVTIALVMMLGLLGIGRPAEACSCGPGSECPIDHPAQLIFVATAHVQAIPEPVGPGPSEAPIVTWHDDFRLSVDLTVVGRKPPDSFRRERATLVVDRAVRGAVRQQYQIVGEGFGTTCDYQFRDGEQYLVYAARLADGSIATSRCTLTKPLRNAAADLAYLAGEGTRGISGTVRGTLRFFDTKREADSIKVVLERPDGERLFAVERKRFEYFEMYPVPPGPYVVSVLLNESDKALRSQVILVAPGQCPRDRVDLTVGTYDDWLSRGRPDNPY